MRQPPSGPAVYRFENIDVDVGNRQIWRSGELVPLNSKYFDVLVFLIENRGTLVEKQRIFEKVWNGVFVTDSALTQCVKDLRRQLGDDASNPRFIRTVPKHGYTFIAETSDGSEAIWSAPAVAGNIRHSGRPFKFLDYYSEQDAALFFGRESEVEVIVSRILAHRTFVLHGKSGVGKSSLLHAGVVQRLRSSGGLVFTLRSFTDPAAQMAEALAQALDLVPDSENPVSINDCIRSLDARLTRPTIIFCLDQFEEFFTLLSEDAKRGFLEMLRTCFAHDATPYHLVFVLREDLLSEMSQLQPVIPEIFHNEYRLSRLTRDKALDAILRPATACGVIFEEGLIERILAELADSEGIDPPQLQIVCDMLFDVRNSQGRIGIEDYERLGGAHGILAGYLDRVLYRFGSLDVDLARAILKELLTPGAERAVLRTADLVSRLAERREGKAADVLDLIGGLVSARILRTRSQDGESWVELAHDYLVKEIASWISSDDRAVREARAIVTRGLDNYRSHQLLLDSEALDLILPIGQRLSLSEVESGLLMESCLKHGLPLPEWLIRKVPAAAEQISAALKDSDPGVRIQGVDACRFLDGEYARISLAGCAVWDPSLRVRTVAVRSLCSVAGASARDLLSVAGEERQVGLLRRSQSLALLRDQSMDLVPLSSVPFMERFAVLLALLALRITGSARMITRLGLGGTIGGAFAGALGSLMLGVGLCVARGEPFASMISLVLVLTSLGGLIGGAGGLGVSFGMVGISAIGRRHSSWWSVLGGTIGGATVGSSTKFLGVDALMTFFGQDPGRVTGAFEGAALGAGLALGAVFIGGWRSESRSRWAIPGAAIGAILSGILLTLVGGNLFSGSLDLVAQSFANSRLQMDPIARWFGEVHFGRTSQVILGAVEAVFFGTGVMAGIQFFAESPKD